MSQCFDRIVSDGYFVGFGGLTDQQMACKQFTKDNLDALLRVRQREKFVKEIRVCCCGYGPADEDEPMEDNNFSQFQFYLPFTNDLVFFHDKFDFLLKCVANGVCKVEEGFEERYMQTLLEVMTFRDTTVPDAPDHVLDLRTLSTPRTIGEVPRTYEENQLLVDSYVKKRNVYAEKLRMELEELEREQFEAEKLRGEHPSVMGWSNPTTPRSKEALLKLSADDASTTRLKTEIQIAREEAILSAEAEQALKDQALIESYLKNGGVKPEQLPHETPLLEMLLRLQQEQVRQESLAAIEKDAAAAAVAEEVRNEAAASAGGETAAAESSDVAPISTAVVSSAEEPAGDAAPAVDEVDPADDGTSPDVK